MIELSTMQQSCISSITNWFITDKQIYVLAGFAGTGKTFLINHIVNVIDVKLSEIRFATFTGKASLVMTRKSNGKYRATTLHKFLYKAKTDNHGNVTFMKKERYEFEFIKLIVIDECSMVSKELLEDLYNTGVRMLFVGDNGQLPPVGEPSDIYTRLCDSPDFMLSEIHRQALDNPIVYLSMLAREGKEIPLGNYGGKVLVVSKKDINKYTKSLLNADIIICAKNDTRHFWNQKIRTLLGFTQPNPQVGDKIICRKNNAKNTANGFGLINGMIGFIKKCQAVSPFKMNLTFMPEFFEVHDGSFKSECLLDKFQTGAIVPKGIKAWLYDHFEFGYVITCHSAQGSQWNKVVIIDEPLYKCDHAKWLYTALTRAEEFVILFV